MNVTDQWMLERMQQMAAAMSSSVPQVGQNADPASKPEKGESFKDLMDKAKDQKTEAPKKTETPKKTEKAEDVQKTDPRKVTETKNPDGTTTKTVKLTAMEAAAVAAGYAALSPVQPDGTVWLAIPVGEGSPANNPLTREILMNHAGIPMEYAFEATMTEDGGQWTLEASEDLVTVLKQFLKAAGDPRSAETVLEGLKGNQNGVLIQPKVEVSSNEADADEEDTTDLSGEIATAQPLFKDVKAAPVKVGENFQLDTEQPDMDANLADAIRYAAQQGMKQIEIKLSPENLGEVTIKLTQGIDGSLQVVLHATNAKAANLLTQHLDGLNTALQGYGQTQVHVEVQRNEDSQQAQQQQHQQADPNGHNQQQHQQQRRQEERHSQDFVQRLRLGLYGLEDII